LFNLSIMFDVIIVGAGAAGLNAALLLGRCRRKVLICDTGQHRNAATRAIHGFLTRDGISPEEFYKTGRKELKTYDTVEFREIEVLDANTTNSGFEVLLKDGTRALARKLLFATGVKDILPNIEGIEEYFGRGVFHCPYCDGWEVRDQTIAIYGNGKKAHGLALELTGWSRTLVICADGKPEFEEHEEEELARHEIAIRTEKVRRLYGSSKSLEGIAFENGEKLDCGAIFFTLGQQQRCSLPKKLGCEFTEKGAVKTGKYEATCVPGLFVAGDASQDVQFAIVAAAEGAQAAFAINTALLIEDLERDRIT
jgi:thioredoxin reductase